MLQIRKIRYKGTCYVTLLRLNYVRIPRVIKSALSDGIHLVNAAHFCVDANVLVICVNFIHTLLKCKT